MSIIIEYLIELTPLVTELIVLTFCCIFFIFFSRKTIQSDLYKMLLLVLPYKLLLFILFNFSLTTSNDFAFADDVAYYDVSKQMSESWKKGRLLSPKEIKYQAEKNPGYYYVSAILMTVFGDSYYITRLFNLFISILIGFYIYLIALKIYDRKQAVLSAYIFLLLPDICFWGSVQFKDLTTTVLTVIIFYYLFFANHKKIILAFILLIPLFFIRVESALLIGITFLLMQIQFNLKKFLYVIGFFVVSFIFLYLRKDLFETSLIIGLGKEAATLIDFTSLLSHIPDFSEKGLLSYGYIFSIYDLWKLPFTIFIVLFTPFPPWFVQENLAASLLSFVSIPWLLLVPLLFYTFLKRLYQYMFFSKAIIVIKPIILFSAFYLTTLSIFLFTFSPLRHRIEVVPFLILLAAPLINNNKRRYLWLLIGVLNFMMFSILYISMKS